MSTKFIVKSKITALGLIEGESYEAEFPDPPNGSVLLSLPGGTQIAISPEAVEIATPMANMAPIPAAGLAPEEEQVLAAIHSGSQNQTTTVQAAASPSTQPTTNTAQNVTGDPMEGLFEPTGSTESINTLTKGVVPVEEVEEAGEVPDPTPELEAGQFKLSEFTDGRLPTSGIDHTITIYDEDHFPEAIRADIPEIDPNFYWDADVFESIHIGHNTDMTVFLVGSPGTGKSSAFRQYAAIIRQPFLRLNGKSGIDASSFFGFLIPSASGAEFKEGMMPMAMRLGYYLVVDEVMKIPAEIMMNFQTVFEEERSLMLDEKPGNLSDKLIIPHKDFHLSVTDNSKGIGDNIEKYASTQVQDSSLLDRIDITKECDYLPPEIEAKVLTSIFPGISEPVANRLVKAANLVRNSFDNEDLPVTLSIRGLKVMCKLMLKGISERTAYIMAYHSKLADDTEVDVSNSVITAVQFRTEPYNVKAEAAMSKGRAALKEAAKDTNAVW